MKVTLKMIGRGLGLLLLAAVCAAPAWSRQAATGVLRGDVADEFGGVIVGATVTATGADGKARTAVTDSDGGFTLSGLAPGRYTVRAHATGFALYENAEVEVRPGRNELPKITLGVSLEKEEVTVASEEALSVDNASAGAIVLKGKDIEALPEDPDELAAALSALAGPAAGPNGGQITIDGFEGGRIPSRDSIREVRINENPLSAERDQPGFGGIQILTKPGTEKLRGSFGGTFNDESLNSRNPLLRSAKRPPFQWRQYSGNLSGTIVPKKASFFLDLDRNETDDNDLVNATILDPLTLAPSGFNQAVLNPKRNFNTSQRVDYAISDSHTLVGRYNYFRTRQQNQGVSLFSLPERAFDTESSSHTLQLTETAVVNKTTVNETRFQLIRNRNEQAALNGGFALNVSEAFQSGGAPVGNSFAENTRWELTNTTTQARGNHSLKFGARVRGISVSDSSENNFNGTYTFSSLEQYRAALQGLAVPTQFSIAAGRPLVEVSQVDFGGFVQDDWKVRPNLTVGFGLRYERQTNISSNFNFAPRLYVAWSPDGTGGRQPKTVIRAGFGIFYDRVAESFTLQSERFNGVNQQQFVVVAPLSDEAIRQLPLPAAQVEAELARAREARALLALYPALPSLGRLSAFALSQTTRQIAPDATAPYSYVGGMIMTRQLTRTTTLNVFFQTMSTRHVLRQRNINAPTETGQRPRPELGNVYQFETSGVQNMAQVSAGLSKQFSRAFSLNGNYTFGKAQSDTDFGGFPMNQYDLRGEYGRTSFDTRHRVAIFGSIAVPYLKLSLNPIVIANTGRAFNITTGFDNNRDSILNDRPAFADALTRPCAAGQRAPFDCDLVQTRWGNFDVNPKPGQTVIPRNYAQGPGFFTVNLRVGRTFGFGDTPASRAAAQQRQQQAEAGRGEGANRGGGRPGGGEGNRGGGPGGPGGPGGRPGVAAGMGNPMMIQMGAPAGGEQKRYTLNFSLHFLNLLNRTNLANPVGNLSSPSFGQSLSAMGGGFGGGGNQAAGNRRIQASVRFNF